MTDKPNPDDFSVNEREGEYSALIQMDGTIRVLIKADSQEEAEAKANKITDDIAEGIEIAELDEVDNISVAYCKKAARMFRVTRNGVKMQVNRLEIGDLPREPDERGF